MRYARKSQENATRAATARKPAWTAAIERTPAQALDAQGTYTFRELR